MAAKMLGRTLDTCIHGHHCRECLPAAMRSKGRRQARRSAKRAERSEWKREVF